MDHIYMQRRRADLADKVAKAPVAQPQLVKVNQKSPKSQTKSSLNVFAKAISFARSKSDEGFAKLRDWRDLRTGLDGD